MSSKTVNYDLHKIGLEDSPPDITVLNQNFDIIDEELKKKYDANNKPTKSDIGLGKVDNTSDTDKPVSTAQAISIADAKKAGTDAQSNLTNHVNNKENPHGVTAAQIGALTPSDVKNNLTSTDTNKPLSAAQGKVLKDLMDALDWFGAGTSIPTGADLNTYKTNGKYYCSSASASKTLVNSPVSNDNFVMYVFTRTTGSSRNQLIITLTGMLYTRGSDSSGDYRNWQRFTNESNLDALKTEILNNLTAHANNTSNPHGVTAAQIGALPVEGGTLKQRLKVANDTAAYSRFEKNEANGKDYGTYIHDVNDEGKQIMLILSADGYTEDPENMGIRLIDINGVGYSIFGTHNTSLLASSLESLISEGGMSTLQSAIQVTNTELKNTNSTFNGTGKGKLFIASGSTVTAVVTIDGKEIGTGHGSSHFEVEFLKSFSVKSNSTANLYCTAVFY